MSAFKIRCSNPLSVKYVTTHVLWQQFSLKEGGLCLQNCIASLHHTAISLIVTNDRDLWYNSIFKATVWCISLATVDLEVVNHPLNCDYFIKRHTTTQLVLKQSNLKNNNGHYSFHLMCERVFRLVIYTPVTLHWYFLSRKTASRKPQVDFLLSLSPSCLGIRSSPIKEHSWD